MRTDFLVALAKTRNKSYLQSLKGTFLTVFVTPSSLLHGAVTPFCIGLYFAGLAFLEGTWGALKGLGVTVIMVVTGVIGGLLGYMHVLYPEEPEVIGDDKE